MNDKRAAIIELHRAGKTNSEIVKLLKAPRSTVYHTVSRFKELQSTDDRPRSGRPRSSRTPKMINALRKAAEGFRGRLERVIQARGGHIE